MFDAEAIVFEAIAQHTGVDPAEFSMRTRLRGSRDIRPRELELILAEIARALGKSLPSVADVRTVGELVELVEGLGAG